MLKFPVARERFMFRKKNRAAQKNTTVRTATTARCAVMTDAMYVTKRMHAPMAVPKRSADGAGIIQRTRLLNESYG